MGRAKEQKHYYDTNDWQDLKLVLCYIIASSTTSRGRAS